MLNIKQNCYKAFKKKHSFIRNCDKLVYYCCNYKVILLRKIYVIYNLDYCFFWIFGLYNNTNFQLNKLKNSLTKQPQPQQLHQNIQKNIHQIIQIMCLGNNSNSMTNVPKKTNTLATWNRIYNEKSTILNSKPTKYKTPSISSLVNNKNINKNININKPSLNSQNGLIQNKSQIASKKLTKQPSWTTKAADSTKFDPIISSKINVQSSSLTTNSKIESIYYSKNNISLSTDTQSVDTKLSNSTSSHLVSNAPTKQTSTISVSSEDDASLQAFLLDCSFSDNEFGDDLDNELNTSVNVMNAKNSGLSKTSSLQKPIKSAKHTLAHSQPQSQSQNHSQSQSLRSSQTSGLFPIQKTPLKTKRHIDYDTTPSSALSWSSSPIYDLTPSSSSSISKLQSFSPRNSVASMHTSTSSSLYNKTNMRSNKKLKDTHSQFNAPKPVLSATAFENDSQYIKYDKENNVAGNKNQIEKQDNNITSGKTSDYINEEDKIDFETATEINIPGDAPWPFAYRMTHPFKMKWNPEEAFMDKNKDEDEERLRLAMQYEQIIANKVGLDHDFEQEFEQILADKAKSTSIDDDDDDEEDDDDDVESEDESKKKDDDDEDDKRIKKKSRTKSKKSSTTKKIDPKDQKLDKETKVKSKLNTKAQSVDSDGLTIKSQNMLLKEDSDDGFGEEIIEDEDDNAAGELEEGDGFKSGEIEEYDDLEGEDLPLYNKIFGRNRRLQEKKKKKIERQEELDREVQKKIGAEMLKHRMGKIEHNDEIQDEEKEITDEEQKNEKDEAEKNKKQDDAENDIEEGRPPNKFRMFKSPGELNIMDMLYADLEEEFSYKTMEEWDRAVKDREAKISKRLEYVKARKDIRALQNQPPVFYQHPELQSLFKEKESKGSTPKSPPKVPRPTSKDIDFRLSYITPSDVKNMRKKRLAEGMDYDYSDMDPAVEPGEIMKVEGEEGVIVLARQPLFLSSVSKNGGSQNSDGLSSELGMSQISLSEEQQEVLQLVVRGVSIFFTGSAGTGKSVLLREIIKELKRLYRNGEVAVTASTGLAACNISGTTLHSFAGIGLGNDTAEKLVKKIRTNRKAHARWNATKVLIIDEISMIDGGLLDKIDQVAKILKKKPTLPFGGIQVIFTGDFFQLPPVTKVNQQVKFAFDSIAWKQAIRKTINLRQVFRQKDQTFVKMLNEMRIGKMSNETIKRFKALERRKSYPDEVLPTELFSTRREVDNSNASRMAALPGTTHTYSAVDTGTMHDKEQLTKMLESSCMAPRVVQLKIGCQVMLIKNIDAMLVNGSTGIVIGFITENLFAEYEKVGARITDNIDEFKDREKRAKGDLSVGDDMLADGKSKRIHSDNMESVVSVFEAALDDPLNSDENIAFYEEKLKRKYNGLRRAVSSKNRDGSGGVLLPVVRFNIIDGTTRDMLITSEEWTVEMPNGEVVAKRTQIPLILAWAISIHKAQGQTLQRVKVDLGSVFERGQAYVALSRATSTSGLELKNFHPHKVRAHERVVEFYESLECVELGLGHRRNKSDNKLPEKKNEVTKKEEKVIYPKNLETFQKKTPGIQHYFKKF